MQAVPAAQEYQQETAPSCTCAQESVDVSYCRRNLNSNSTLLSTQTHNMDSKDSKLVEEKETTLQELLEEVPMVETSLNNPRKNLNSKYAVVVN